MRKQYFILLLIGLIAVAGVMFTGCPEVEYTFNFENYTAYTIKVESQDLTPSSFEIAGLKNEIDDPTDIKTATSTKSNPKIGYLRKNDSTGGATDTTVKLIKTGSTYQFWPKGEFGDLSIKKSRNEQ